MLLENERDFLAKHKTEHDCEVRDKRVPVETFYVGSHIYSSKRIHLCTDMSGICELVKIAIFQGKKLKYITVQNIEITMFKYSFSFSNSL